MFQFQLRHFFRLHPTDWLTDRQWVCSERRCRRGPDQKGWRIAPHLQRSFVITCSIRNNVIRLCFVRKKYISLVSGRYASWLSVSWDNLRTEVTTLNWHAPAGRPAIGWRRGTDRWRHCWHSSNTGIARRAPPYVRSFIIYGRRRCQHRTTGRYCVGGRRGALDTPNLIANRCESTDRPPPPTRDIRRRRAATVDALALYLIYANASSSRRAP